MYILYKTVKLHIDKLKFLWYNFFGTKLGDDELIWEDMSYNKFDIDFLNKLYTEPEENEAEFIKLVKTLKEDNEEENIY